MESLTWAVLTVLAATWLVQACLVVGFVIRLSRSRRPALADESCPTATVVLCLRGSDPFLPACLAAIIDQDYPRFTIRVVVDQADDPAYGAVRDAQASHPNAPLQVEFLRNRLPTCSLKCSSVVQVVTEVVDQCDFIAQLDADTIPHRTWLRELAATLRDPRVGAATGNRWYMPEDRGWGSLVRYVWNAAAVVQMYWYQIAWGGTLAVKTRVIREAGLIDRWSHAFCEDTMLFAQLRGHGYQVAFAPTLMMVNRERCDLPGFFSWVRRQLLTARLYHPGWPAVVVHGLGTPLALLSATALAIAAAAAGDWSSTGQLLLGLLAYQLGAIGLLWPIEWSVRRVVRARGESTAWLDPVKWLYQTAAVLVTQFVYPAALASAMTLRYVDWRQARYAIRGPWRIELLEQHPYRAADSLAEPTDDQRTASL